MKLVENAGVVLAFLAATSVLGVLASAVVARAVGPAIMGVLAIGLFLIEVASILDNWSTSAHVRQASAVDEEELPRLFTTHLLMKAAFGATAGVVVWLAAPWIASIFQADPEIFRLFAFVPPFGAASSAIHNTLEARGRMLERGIMDVVTAGGYLAFAVFFVASGPDAVMGRIVAAAGTLLVGAAMFFPGLDRPDADLARHYLDFGSKTGPSQLVMKTIFWADTALLAFLVGNAAAGLYQVAYSIAFFQTVAASSISTALFPELSRGALRDGEERFREAFDKGFIMVAGLLGVGSVALVLAAPAVVPFLYGSAFAGSVSILQLLALSFLLDGLGIPSSLALTAAGRPGTVLKIQVLMASVNVGANLVLIPRYGITGAVGTTFVTFGLGSALEIVAARGILDLSPPTEPGAYRSFVSEAYEGLRARISQTP